MTLYGLAEIADAAGVKHGTVRVWHHRNQLPEPDHELKMGPIWEASTIESWIDSTRDNGGPPKRKAKGRCPGCGRELYGARIVRKVVQAGKCGSCR